MYFLKLKSKVLFQKLAKLKYIIRTSMIHDFFYLLGEKKMIFGYKACIPILYVPFFFLMDIFPH